MVARVVACLLFAGFGLLLPASDSASLTPEATIPVNTLTDELNSDGDCSLREAIRAANLDQAVDACPAGSGAQSSPQHSGSMARNRSTRAAVRGRTGLRMRVRSRNMVSAVEHTRCSRSGSPLFANSQGLCSLM